MATIKEVAKMANTSVATVSRVINKNGNVKEETSKRILKVIDELGYSPNMLGINLRNNTSKLTIVTLPELVNPLYSIIIDGISNCAAYHGYNILTATTSANPEKEIQYYDMVRNKLADGVIALSVHTDVETFNNYANIIPIVRCCKYPEGAKVTSLSIDDESSIYEMTEFLYKKKGRRHIAYMGISEFAEISSQRICRENGYRRAAKEFGFEELITNSHYNYDSGLEESRILFEAHPEIDAVVCATDVMAFNTIKTLKSIGKRVPDDVCVTGFDNSNIALLSSPQITSIDQESYETGYRAMEALYQSIITGSKEIHNLRIPYRIEERESTGRDI